MLTLAGIVVALAPEGGPSPLGAGGGPGPGSGASPPPGDIAQVQAIVEQRCVPCHSTHPSSKFGFSAPPNGIILETLDQLRAHLPEVQKQVSLRTMPLGNLTGMTDAERTRVLMWIGHGAAGRAGRSP